MRLPISVLAALSLFACSAEVTPNNPFDPSASAQDKAKASVRGRIAAPSLGSLQGLAVGLETNNKPQHQVFVAADGSFLFAELEPGAYAVRCAPEGFLPQVVQVTLGAGDDVDLGLVTLVVQSGADASAITGLVTLADQLDHSGTLVEAVGREFTAVTGTSGAYRLALVQGTYKLRFTHKDFVSFTVDAVAVGRGEARVLEPVALLANPATASGHVDGERVGGGRGPLANAAVTLEGTSITGLTNAAGDFTLTGIPPGSYLLRVIKTGMVDAAQPVLNLAGGEARTLDEPFYLALARGGIAGTVRLADTADARDVLVDVTGAGRTQKTGSAGRFVFDDLVAGTYELTASKDAYALRVLGTFTVAADGLTDVGSFTLARQGGAVTIVQAPYTRVRGVSLQLVATGATGFHASLDPLFADRARGDHATDAWRPYQPGTPFTFTLADADGAQTVHVVFFDGVTVTAPASASIVLDRLAPLGPRVLIGGGAAQSNAPGGIVSLDLNAVDLPANIGAAVSGLDKMHLANRPDFGGATVLDFNRAATWTLDAASVDGRKTVFARFTDRAGNVSDASSAVVILDTRAPSSPAIALAGADPGRPDLTTSPIVTATLSAVDPNGGAGNVELLVRLSNTSGFVGARYLPFAPELSWLLAPGDGAKTVYAQFMDPAGNESIVANAAITLDTGAPTSPLVTILEGDARSDNGFTNLRRVTLRLSAAGAPAFAQVSESVNLSDGATTVILSGGGPVAIPFDLGGTGLRTVWARFFDAAGNGSALASAQVTVDEIRPAALAPVLAPGAVVQNTALTLIPPSAGQDELRIVSAGVVSPVGFVSATPGVPIPVTLVAGDGVKTLLVTYRDTSDNTTDLAPIAVTLDGNAPAAVAFTVRGILGDASTSATLTARAAVTLDLSAQTDLLSGVAQMRLSNLPALTDAAYQPFVASGALPWTLTPSDGPKIVYARFKDAAGNESGVVQGAIELVASPPSSSSLVIGSGADTTTDRFVRLNVSAVGAAELAWSTDGFAGAPSWSSYTTTVNNVDLGTTDQVRKVITLRFRNRARVEGAGVSASVYYDRTPPGAPANGTMSILGALGDGGASTDFTARPAVVVRFQQRPTADTAEVALAQVAPGSCAGAFGAPQWQPFTFSPSFVLTGADGPKQLCAIFRDTAGNASTTATASASIILDIAGPTAPVLASQQEVVRATSLSVGMTSLSTDANLRGYQTATGFSPAWSAPILTNGPFTFPLTANALNMLWVRGVDRAGNAGPAVVVQVIHDDQNPAPPQILVPRRYVNATSTSVSFFGSEGDANFAGYQTCLADVYTSEGCPSTCSTYAAQPSTAAVPLAANRKTCLFARGLDRAANASDPTLVEIVSDLLTPLPPGLAPVFDPSALTLHADYVDVFITPAVDPGYEFAARPYRGISHLEIDSGAGFDALCRPESFTDTFDPCAARCADPRLRCAVRVDAQSRRTTQLSGIRVQLVPGASNRIAVRAVDLAGNVGDGVGIVVNAEGSAPLVTSPGSQGVGSLAGSLLAYASNTAAILLDLGPDRRLDPGDPTCALNGVGDGTLTAASSAGVFFTRSSYRQLWLRTRGPDERFCSSDDIDLLVRDGGTSGTFATVSQSGNRAVWNDVEQAAPNRSRVRILDASSDRRLFTADDVLSLLDTYSDFVTGTRLGGDALLISRNGCPTACGNYWDLVSAGKRADGTRAFGAPGTTKLVLGSNVLGAALSQDGRVLFTADTGFPATLSVRTPGQDGIYGSSDDVVASRPFPELVAFNWDLAIDGVHAVTVAGPGVGPTHITDWNAGGDARFGTSDDTLRQILPSSATRGSPNLSGGLLVYSAYQGAIPADLFSLDLTSMRWAAVRTGQFQPVLNGEGTFFFDDSIAADDHVRAVSADGTESRGLLYANAAFNQSIAATGRDLVFIGSSQQTVPLQGLDVQSAGTDGLWFTADDPPPQGVWISSDSFGELRAGGGKALVVVNNGSGYKPWVIEPTGGSLGNTRCPGPKCVDLEAGAALPIATSSYIFGGISDLHAVWYGVYNFQYTVAFHDAGSDRIFGTPDDSPTDALRRYPDQPGVRYIDLSDVRMAGNRLVMIDFGDLVVVDAGADLRFNTLDDRRTIVPLGGLTRGEFAMAGDFVAYTAAGASGGYQVYLYNVVTGVTTQQSFHYSPKSNVAVDPSGRAIWQDGLFAEASIFVSIP